MSFSGAKIYCFEPLRVPFEDLKKWAKEEKRVSAFNFALGDKEGEIEMFLHSEHDDSSSVLGTTETCEKIYAATKKQRKVSVPQITLDKAAEKLLKDSLVPEILVKVDVQGYEKHVISGGKEVLSRTKACILEVCSDRLYQGQTDFREIFLLMDSLGFTYIGNLEQVSATDGHVVHFDAVFIRK
jgi:FkbM family methyltransferase